MFTNEIIQTYEAWYVKLSDGSNIKCQIYPGYEYEIETEWIYRKRKYIAIVYNLNNGKCKPNEHIEELKNTYEKIISKDKNKYYQTTIFDFLEEKNG